jgi:hypothetical protein
MVYPQRRRSLRNKEGAPVKDVDTIYVVSDCQLSNDPPSDGEEILPLHLCNIREYNCLGEGTVQETNDLVISYDYEVLYNQNADFDQVRAYLEEAMLDHVARATNTVGCSASFTRRSLQNDLGVVGVNLDPPDVPDDRFDSCLTDGECRSMIGGMTVLLTPDVGEKEIRQTVLDLVRFGMDEDMYTVPGTIDRVVFIENRTIQEKVGGADLLIDDVDNYGTGDEGGGSSAMALGVAGGLIGLLILVLAALSVSRRRKKTVEVVADDLSLDCSLAHRDSLALKPQYDAPEEEFVPPPPSRTSNNTVVVGRSDENVQPDSNITPDASKKSKETQPDTVEEADDGEVDDSDEEADLVMYGVLQALATGTSRPDTEEELHQTTPRPKSVMSDDHSGLFSQSMSEDYETGSDGTPRRVLQMT